MIKGRPFWFATWGLLVIAAAIAAPNWTQHFQNLLSAAQLPTPPPKPWHNLSDFCDANPTTKPAYRGLRVCILAWRLHYKYTNQQYSQGEAVEFGFRDRDETAISLGQSLGTDLSPKVRWDNQQWGLFWTWTKPASADWSDYLYCRSTNILSWRIPNKDGKLDYGFTARTNDSWTFKIGGEDPHQGPFDLLPHRVDIGEEIFYVYIHKDDLDAGVKNKICSPLTKSK